jgi:hypothetical protein
MHLLHIPDDADKKENTSKCHICLRQKPLTKEHIPPKSAYNCYNGLWEYLFTDEDRLVSRSQKIRGGFGVQTLCKDCNNTVCAPYANAYVKFVRHLVETPALVNPSGDARVISVRQNTLFIAKEIATMILAVQHLKFAELHEELRNFVLDRDAVMLTMPFDVLCFLVPKSSASGTVSPFHERVATFAPGFELSGAEISWYPFGFVYAATIGHRYRPERMTNVNHWFTQRQPRTPDTVKLFCHVTGIESINCALGNKRTNPQKDFLV